MGTFGIQPSGGGGGIGGAIVISKTVAEMQALVGSFTAGQLYKITDAYSNTASILIKAYSVSTLEDYGFGIYTDVLSATVNCFLWYDLTSDTVSRIYEPIRNNDIRARENNPIGTFPFSDTNYYNNTLNNCTFIRPSTGYIQGCTFKDNSTINCLSDHDAGIMLIDCVVGASKTMDFKDILRNYTATGKIYEGMVSTFSVTASDFAEVNPTAATLDMQKFPWAGILITSTGVDEQLNAFSSYPTDHDWILYPASDNVSVADKSAGGGGNIRLESTSAINLVSAKSSWLQFRASYDNPGTIVNKVGGAVYATT